MRYKITKECISCGMCMEECKNNAIIPESNTKLYSKMKIINKRCNDCGDCFEICKVGAIEDLYEE